MTPMRCQALRWPNRLHNHRSSPLSEKTPTKTVEKPSAICPIRTKSPAFRLSNSKTWKRKIENLCIPRGVYFSFYTLKQGGIFFERCGEEFSYIEKILLLKIGKDWKIFCCWIIEISYNHPLQKLLQPTFFSLLSKK